MLFKVVEYRGLGREGSNGTGPGRVEGWSKTVDCIRLTSTITEYRLVFSDILFV